MLKNTGIECPEELKWVKEVLGRGKAKDWKIKVREGGQVRSWKN